MCSSLSFAAEGLLQKIMNINKQGCFSFSHSISHRLLPLLDSLGLVAKRDRFSWAGLSIPVTQTIQWPHLWTLLRSKRLRKLGWDVRMYPSPPTSGFTGKLWSAHTQHMVLHCRCWVVCVEDICAAASWKTPCPFLGFSSLGHLGLLLQLCARRGGW